MNLFIEKIYNSSERQVFIPNEPQERAIVRKSFVDGLELKFIR